MTSALADFENAIAYAHFKLRGGARNVLLSALAYLAILAVAASLIYSLTRPNTRSMALDALAYGLLALQMLLFVGYGMFTTGAAVKTDLTGQLIESHRLMPLSSGRAIFGYLVGAPSQAYTLFVGNLLVGFGICVFNGSAGGATGRMWFLRNGVIFVFAVFIFALTIFWSFLGRNIGRYVVAITVLYFMTTQLLFAYLPACFLVASPFIGSTIFFGQSEIGWIHGLAALVQGTLTLLLLTAATRKYRRPHLPAFSTPLALLLLAALVGTSGAAIFFWEAIKPPYYAYRSIDAPFQFVSSTASLMLVAMLPVASAARTYANHRRSGTSADPASRHPSHPAFAAAVAAVLCLLLLVVAPPGTMVQPATGTAIVVSSFLLSFAFLLTWSYSITTRPAILIIVWLVLTWVGPLVADSIRYNLADNPTGPVLGSLSVASPFGALVQLWSRTLAPTTPGLAFQVALMAITIAMNVLAPSRRAPRAPVLAQ